MKGSRTSFILLLSCCRLVGSFVPPPTCRDLQSHRRTIVGFDGDHAGVALFVEVLMLASRRSLREPGSDRRLQQSTGSSTTSFRVSMGMESASRAGNKARLRSQPKAAAGALPLPAGGGSPPPGIGSAVGSHYDGVSYLQNVETGSRIVLVGVVHGKAQSVKLVERLVRETNPEVVMLELDAHRLEDLPPGKVQETEDGLSWFTPDDTSKPGTSESPATPRPKRGTFSFLLDRAANLLVGAVDALDDFLGMSTGEDASEMETAVREAQACGARVLLGDRDFEETKRRLVAAGLADSVEDERLDNPEALLHNSMSKSNKRAFARLLLKKPETREAAQEYFSALQTVCDQRALTAMIPERDEVMAGNLMTLEGKQTIVALLGIFHVDGIERILTSNGWQPQELSW